MRPRSDAFPLDPSKPLIPVDVLLQGPKGRQFVRMALDTGATYTIAPRGTLLAIGCDPALSTKRVEFIAVGSIEYKPLISVQAVKRSGFGLRAWTSCVMICHPRVRSAACWG